METDTKDVEGARRALAEAEAGGRAIRSTRPAPWFVPAAAALVAVIALGQLLPWGGALAVALLAAVAFGALFAANARATGIQTSARHGGDARAGGLAALAIVVLFGVAALVDRPLGWVLCAALAGAGVLVGGRLAAPRA